MRKFLNFLLAIAAFALTSCLTMKTAAADTPTPKPDIANLTAQKLSATITADYLLFLPKGYDADAAKRWPLILFLHGSGERGADVWRTTIHGPTKFIQTHPDFPFILVTPQCPAGNKWSDDILLALLDSVTAKYAVDTNRIYLTGLSMGGYGAWSLATTCPERFAAVAPICGGEGNIGVVLTLQEKERLAKLKQLPIWVFHGAKDNIVALEESERMVNILKKAGNNDVKLTIYPEATHNSWTVSYNNPKLYDWFLQHERK
jgi:predicted peptidase